MQAAQAGNAAEVSRLLTGGDQIRGCKATRQPLSDRSEIRMALKWAVTNGHGLLVATFADCGTNVSLRFSDGSTPLMYAAWYGQSGVVQQLLALGADHTAIGKKQWLGKTAMTIAEQQLDDVVAEPPPRDGPRDGATRQHYECVAAVLREWATNQSGAETHGAAAMVGGGAARE